MVVPPGSLPGTWGISPTASETLPERERGQAKGGCQWKQHGNWGELCNASEAAAKGVYFLCNNSQQLRSHTNSQQAGEEKGEYTGGRTMSLFSPSSASCSYACLSLLFKFALMPSPLTSLLSTTLAQWLCYSKQRVPVSSHVLRAWYSATCWQRRHLFSGTIKPVIKVTGLQPKPQSSGHCCCWADPSCCPVALGNITRSLTKLTVDN